MSKQFIHQAGTLTKVFFARLRFVAVFVIAAGVIGYWDNIKNHIDKWTRPAIAPDSLVSAAKSDIEFYCPMHPDVIRDEAGVCPKCGMPLVKRKRGEAVKLPIDVLARVQLTPQRIALANVQTSTVEYKPLERQIRAVGLFDYDETRLARLSARVSGRADELFINSTGQAIKRGEPVYSIYSPDVFTAQREYLLARSRVNELHKDAAADMRADATAVYNASLQKLALWGVSSEQLDKLDDEFDRTGKIPTDLIVTSPISGIVVKKTIDQGQYVQVGDSPYVVADLTTLWLQVKLYEQDVPLVHVGDMVEITADAFPGEMFTGTVAFKSFQLDPGTRTLDARVEVSNSSLRLRPGMYATAIIDAPIQPSTQPASTQPTMNLALAPQAFAAALKPYLAAQQLLANDKADGVAADLAQTAAALEPLKDDADIADSYKAFIDATKAADGQPIDGLRAAFKDASIALIDIGKAVGLTPDAPAVRVYHCPMKKANWLQTGDVTLNPYYGLGEMQSCGDPIATLRVAPSTPATTLPQSIPHGKNVLAIPRSAVIRTGDKDIVYVESSPGAYDMKAVTLGPPAGDDYPILSGVEEGDRVVTVGTFLVDAENRLNPTKVEH